jgi:hypothetical protein
VKKEDETTEEEKTRDEKEIRNVKTFPPSMGSVLP